jgi:hypothetical protein
MNQVITTHHFMAVETRLLSRPYVSCLTEIEMRKLLHFYLRVDFYKGKTIIGNNDFSKFNYLNGGNYKKVVRSLVEKGFIKTYKHGGKSNLTTTITLFVPLYDEEKKEFISMGGQWRNSKSMYNKNGIIDLFGGLHDIENKIVKCVGYPDERLNEDGLRILRALRFASVLDFSIDDQTADSIYRNKGLLNDISTERINMEFNKLIMGSNYQSILLNYRQIIEVFLPEIKDLTNQELEYRLYSMKALNSLTLRLALLLHGMEPTDKILMNLKYDNKTVKTVKLLTENINEKIHPDPVTIKKWLNKLDYENLASLIKIKKALFDKEYEKLTKSQAIMEEILASNQCYSLKTLAVNGQDLLDAGIPKGRRIGMVLNKVLGEVIEGKLENKKDVLLNYIYGLQKTVDKDDD